MRLMTHADINAVLILEQEVQRYPWTCGNFADALNSGYLCLVDASENGEIFGYAILMPVVDEAELLNIAVAKTRQRAGLGRAILSEMLHAARATKMRRVFLEVRPSNVAAMALYGSAGFREIGVRRAYYRNADGCEDAVAMACELTGEPNG